MIVDAKKRVIIFGKSCDYEEKTIHIILKWNEAAIFHSEAPDTILAHCQILKIFSKTDKYVWWGKVSVSGYLGLKKMISNQ